MNEDTLQALMFQKENTREVAHGCAVILIAWSFSVFGQTPREDIIFETGASLFKSEDIEVMNTWKKAIENTK